MPDLAPIRRALLSVSDKTGLVDLKTVLGGGFEGGNPLTRKAFQPLGP